MVGAELATAPDAIDRQKPGETRVTAAMVEGLDALLAETEAAVELPREFVVPGETRLSAALELARTIVRRAERRAVTIRRLEPVADGSGRAVPQPPRGSAMGSRPRGRAGRVENRHSVQGGGWWASPKRRRLTGRGVPLVSAAREGLGPIGSGASTAGGLAGVCGTKPARGCIIRPMTPAGRPRHDHVSARLAAAFVLVAVVAACGTATATPSPISSRSATPASSSSVPTSSSTATPSVSIVPVPTSQQAAPASPATHLDAATATALQAALDSIRSGGRYPGVSAAIVFPDGSDVDRGLGHGDPLLGDEGRGRHHLLGREHHQDVRGGARLPAGHGRHDQPRRPPGQVRPDFPRAASITVRQLLTHTTGIRDLFQDLGTKILAYPSRTWTAQQVLDGIANKPWCAPGKCYRYSNTDYILLGLVIEKATGQKVSRLVRDAFLEPLGLGHTYLQTEERVQGAVAHGYVGSASKPVDNYDGSMLPFTSEATAVGVSGAYVSTASDLAIWGNALYGGDVLDRATLSTWSTSRRRCRTRRAPSSGTPFGVGSAWRRPRSPAR